MGVSPIKEIIASLLKNEGDVVKITFSGDMNVNDLHAICSTLAVCNKNISLNLFGNKVGDKGLIIICDLIRVTHDSTPSFYMILLSFCLSRTIRTSDN